MKIVDNNSADLPTYVASSDFGGYAVANDELGDIMSSGNYTGSVSYGYVDII